VSARRVPGKRDHLDTTPSAQETSARDGSPPLLRILTPDTTPEEVAAIVAVLAAMGSTEPGEPRRRSEWNNPYRQVRPFYSHGPGGWRSSGLPRHRGRGN
jgi:hypothetical protein